MTKQNKAEENSRKTAPKLTIFIDESGTLPDPTDKFIVICGVGVGQTKEAKNISGKNNQLAGNKKKKHKPDKKPHLNRCKHPSK